MTHHSFEYVDINACLSFLKIVILLLNKNSVTSNHPEILSTLSLAKQILTTCLQWKPASVI